MSMHARILSVVIAALAAGCTNASPADFASDTTDSETLLPSGLLLSGLTLCLWDANFAPGCVLPLEIKLAAVGAGSWGAKRLLNVRNGTDTDFTLTLKGSDPWILLPGGTERTIAAGSSATVEVRVIPGTEPGRLQGTLTLQTTLEGEPWSQVIPLSGLVRGCPPGTANCDGDWLNGCECDLQCQPWHYGIQCEPCHGMVGGLPCTQHGVCDDGVSGDGRCICDVGWKGGGCEVDINECIENAPCHDHAVCENYPGTFTCTCDPGWIGSGVTCSPAPCGPLDIENGSSLPATNHGITVGLFECDPGFVSVPEDLPRCDFGAWIVPFCVPEEPEPGR